MQNGEIYNYVELRAELETLGRRFTTTSDTEVIAQAYAEWGPACLDRMNGDFAFAAWDRREQELFLARDRFGVRPLFVAELGGDLVFASEQKAILRHPRPGASSIRPARRELHHVVHLAGCLVVPRHPGAGARALPPRRAGGHPRGAARWDLRFSDAPDVPPAQRRPSPRSSTPSSPTPRACACAPTSPSPPT